MLASILVSSLAGWPARTALAQGAGTAGAPPASGAAEPAPGQSAPAAPPNGAPPAAAAPAFVPSAPGPMEEAPPERRAKPLRLTTGLLPTAADLGSEADLVSTGDNEAAIAESLKKWTFNLKGYMRAPMRIGWGPSCADRADLDGNRRCQAGEEPHTEFHSPPRMVGFASGDWTYVGLAPNTSGSLRVTVANPLVSANVIFSANTFSDSGFMDLDQIGGLSQAYITLKFPDAFGPWGGLAWSVGAFSNRYGNAGPNQSNSGHYGTYLFGRTHVAGETLTADIDLNDDLELVLEHGIGAKLDVTPYLGLYAFQPAYFPGQGHTNEGSNYLHHAHAALLANRWLQVGAHYLTSWTPNDRQPATVKNPPEGRLTVVGGDVHVDDDDFGHGYIGYSHVDAKNLLPLGDALQVIHGGDGYNFKLEYFGSKDRRVTINRTPSNDAGTVDTILFEYLLRLAPVLGESLPIHDVGIWAYGMFNHVHTLQTHPIALLGNGDDPESSSDRIKFGAEVEFALLKYLSLDFRFDRVIPNLSDDSDAYTALSPRAIFHTNWKSKEYIIVNYTHFLLGPLAFPSSPYSSLTTIDKDMIMVSATMSF